MLGPLETVTVKTAFSRSAAAVKSFPTVHKELKAAATRHGDAVDTPRARR